MKKLLLISAVSSVFLLAACGGQGDDKLADRVEDRADEKADMLENKADQMEENADKLRDQADKVEERGDDRAAAIDAADVNADAMTVEQKQAIANNESPAVR